MGKYRKKPVVVEAHQWFYNGDHPEDESETLSSTDFGELKTEGKVVRRFDTNFLSKQAECCVCDKLYSLHGWVDTLEGGHRVCPGDYIITGVQGERYPCKPDIFLETYESVDEAK